jgi:hypothetical protein
MDNDLVTYIERLELMGFFAGYPFIFALVHYIAGGQRKKTGALPERLKKLLPLAYALTGTLYFGLIMSNIFPDYSFKNIAAQFQNPFQLWGLLSVLCWLPVFRKKAYFSVLHSLPVFLLLFKDLVTGIYYSGGGDMIKNDMKIYTDSLLVNTGTLVLVTIIFFLQNRARQRNNVSSF